MSHSSTTRAFALLVAGSIGLACSAKAFAAVDKLSSTDQDYLRQATQEVLGEIEMSRMAKTEVKHDDVKHFAELEVQGEEKMEKELHTLADKHQYVLPGKDVFAKATEERMAKVKSGATFEKEYLSGEVRDHEEMIKLFTHASENAENQGVKDWFAEKVKDLKAQLTSAKELDSKYGK